MKRMYSKLPLWMSGRLKNSEIASTQALLTVGCLECDFHRRVDVSALIERDCAQASLYNRGMDCPRGCSTGCGFYLSVGRGTFVRPFRNLDNPAPLLRVDLPEHILLPLPSALPRSTNSG